MQETQSGLEHWQLLTDLFVGFFLDPMSRDADLAGLDPVRYEPLDLKNFPS